VNRKIRNLLILLLATAAVGALFWMLSRDEITDSDEHDHDYSVSESDEEPERKSGVLLDYSPDNIKTITFTNSQAKYTAYLDKKKGEVAFRELEGYSVNASFMETIWYGSVQIIYKDIAGSTKDINYNPHDYGLDKPLLKLSGVLKDGKKFSFRVGNKTPGYENDVYYLTVGGDSNIYVCSMENGFFMGNSYFLSDDIFSDYDTEKDGTKKNTIKIGDITLSGSEFNGEFRMKVNTTADMSSPFYGYSYVVTAPINWPVKISSSSMLVSELQYLMAEDVAVLKPSAKQLRKYGLAKPYLTISFKRNGKNCVMYCSKPDSEKMYVILKDHDIIFELNVNSLSILHKLSPEVMYGINAISATLEGIAGMKISGQNVNSDIVVTRKQNDSSAEEGSVVYTYSVTKNGSEIKYSSYTKLIKQLNASAILQWNVKKPSGKPSVTITLSFFENFSRRKETIRLYKYSDREYAVVREGLPVNTVSATWVKQLLADADQL